MKRKHKKKPSLFRKIAKEHIEELFEQAKIMFKESPELSDRYVYLARKIAMKYKIKLPGELKKRFCKHCYSYLLPGENARIRLNKSKVVYFCKKCKKHMRFPYK